MVLQSDQLQINRTFMIIDSPLFLFSFKNWYKSYYMWELIQSFQLHSQLWAIVILWLANILHSDCPVTVIWLTTAKLMYRHIIFFIVLYFRLKHKTYAWEVHTVKLWFAIKLNELVCYKAFGERKSFSHVVILSTLTTKVASCQPYI